VLLSRAAPGGGRAVHTSSTQPGFCLAGALPKGAFGEWTDGASVRQVSSNRGHLEILKEEEEMYSSQAPLHRMQGLVKRTT
jgi:hypothetical protein